MWHYKDRVRPTRELAMMNILTAPQKYVSIFDPFEPSLAGVFYPGPLSSGSNLCIFVHIRRFRRED